MNALDIIILASMIVLIALSGLFSGAEIALFSLDNIKVRKLVKQKRRGARSLKKIKSDPHRLLVTILICNNVVNITAASLATMVAIDAFGSNGLGIATGLMTFMILIFGEITPKSYFHLRNERMSLLVAKPLRVLTVVLYPVIIFVEAISNGLLRMLRVKKKQSQITEEELIAALSLSAEAGVIERGEQRMMQNVIEFGDMIVKDVMIPRKHMVSLSSNEKIVDAITKMLESRYSRVPVFGHGTSDIIGIVHLKDILHHTKSKDFDKPVVQALSPVIYVKSGDRISDVFDKLRENATHMAIVKDSAGRLVGLVTMEDLLEEIVGEIYDEADKRRQKIHFMDARTAVTSGDVLVEDLMKVIGLQLRSGASISEAISGRLDRQPVAGQTVDLKDFIITVLGVSRKDKTQITRLKIVKKRGRIRKG